MRGGEIARAAGQRLREGGWRRQGALRWALAPAALLYGGAVLARRVAYRVGLRRVQRVAVPVVSVGNLTVGGTGKTPTALWLAERLLAAGARPAIVSRGYGAALGGRVVTAVPVGRGAAEAGDEAAVLAERFAGPVVCAVDRVAAARWAIEHHGADAIVLDDGFQHWRLGRDLDIVLVDGQRAFGNGTLLPAGPLREPLAALERADALLVTKAAPSAALAASLARRVPAVPVLRADLAPSGLVGVDDGSPVLRPLGDLVGRRVVTVSGIAEPESFYDLLGQLDARAVEVLEFPDHHEYSQGDWQRITHAARAADLVVCTEKDLVKLRRFPFARGRLLALRVELALAPADEARLLELVRERTGVGVGLRAADDHATNPPR